MAAEVVEVVEAAEVVVDVEEVEAERRAWPGRATFWGWDAGMRLAACGGPAEPCADGANHGQAETSWNGRCHQGAGHVPQASPSPLPLGLDA